MTDSYVAVGILRQDGIAEIAFAGRLAAALPTTSIFPKVDAAAGFFSLGATGYSATRSPGHFHGMELHSLDWTVRPLGLGMSAALHARG